VSIKIQKIVKLVKAKKKENKSLEQLKDSLNAIPGIKVTCDTENLGGKTNGSYAIWITLKDTKTLNTFLWGGCHRWWLWNKDWKVTVDVADPNKGEDKKIKLMLESVLKGDKALAPTLEFSEKLKKFKEEAKEYLAKKAIKKII